MDKVLPRFPEQIAEQEARYRVAIWLRDHPRDTAVPMLRLNNTPWLQIAALVCPETGKADV
jgi:hypothetical protein